MTEQPDLAMLIFACVMVSAIVTYLIQIVTKRWFPYILKIPYHYLYTVILVISFIGGYGISNTMFNIYVMLALCLLSLFMSVAGSGPPARWCWRSSCPASWSGTSVRASATPTAAMPPSLPVPSP